MKVDQCQSLSMCVDDPVSLQREMVEIRRLESNRFRLLQNIEDGEGMTSPSILTPSLDFYL